MKIFYNDEGEILGTVEASPKVEQGFEMPGAHKMEAPDDVARAIRDRNRPELHNHFKVKNGKVAKKKNPPKPKKSKEDGLEIEEVFFNKQGNN